MRILLPISLSILSLILSTYSRSNLLCTSNSGFAFGLHFNYFEIFSVILIGILIWIYIKMKGKMRYNVLGLAILGSFNLLERIIFGDICDYISLLGISVNLIDISIVVNTIILIYLLLRNERDN